MAFAYTGASSSSDKPCLGLPGIPRVPGATSQASDETSFKRAPSGCEGWEGEPSCL